jgi:large subunit ribosomal protein L25
MKTFELKTSLRKSTGKKDAKALRKNDHVPCVMYGGEKNVHFHAEEKAFKDLIYTHHVYIINLDIDGQKHQAIIKEAQFHPVTDRLIHLDFVEVFPDKPVIIELPVEITGNSVGIRAGGKLRQRRRYLKVKGMIDKLPDSLVIDITNLDVGDSIFAGDVQYPEVEILVPPRALVVGVVSSRVAAKGMVEAAEAAPEAAAEEAAAGAAEETEK